VLAGWLTTALLALLLIPLLRVDRAARFWASGLLLSLLPAAAVLPSNRVLFFAGLGGMGLLAELLGGVVEGAAWRPRARAFRLAAAVSAALLALVHLIVAPLL